jgi:hypothetical protein
MDTISHYIDIRRTRICRYVVDWPIYKTCRAGVGKRGLLPQQW